MVLVTRKADSDNIKRSADFQEENNKILKSNTKNKKRGWIVGALITIGATVLSFILGSVF